MMWKSHPKVSLGFLKINSNTGLQLNQHQPTETNLDKRLERKISKWYGAGERTRYWLAKHWHRFITYGCPMCWREGCGCNSSSKNINNPKGFAELSEYCYKNYR